MKKPRRDCLSQRNGIGNAVQGTAGGDAAGTSGAERGRPERPAMEKFLYEIGLCATFAASSSPKNAQGRSGPELHPIKKNRCYLGMKARIRMGAGSGPVHTVNTMATGADVVQVAEGQAKTRAQIRERRRASVRRPPELRSRAATCSCKWCASVETDDARRDFDFFMPFSNRRRGPTERARNNPRWPPQIAPLMAGQTAPGRTTGLSVFLSFFLNGCLASEARQAGGEGRGAVGKPRTPPGAVHRPVLWAGGLSTAGGCARGQSLVSTFTARRCAASLSR
jgi:hypothetical protein